MGKCSVSNARILVSLAILKTNWDKGQDYLENFMPFILECIRTQNENIVSIEILSACLKENFGFNIPKNPLKTLLKRAKKQKYLSIENGVYYKTDKIEGTDFNKKEMMPWLH